MNDFLPDVPAVAVIMFLVWVATNLGLPKRFAPLLAWITGLVIAYFSNVNYAVLDLIYYGTFLAASAIGFHSGGKNTFQQFTNGNKDTPNNNTGNDNPNNKVDPK